jgi:hypothetical protein
VHGWSDDVFLPEKSIRYAKEADCTLHLISGDIGEINRFQRIRRKISIDTRTISPRATDNVRL